MENKNKIIDFLLAIFIVIGLSQSCNNKTKVINTFDKLIENGEAIQYDNTGRRIYDYER